MKAARLPRVSEKVVQRHIVQALRSVGATVYVLGTVHAGEPGRMTTRQTPGIPDLYAILPDSPVPGVVGPRYGYGAGRSVAHGLWIEVKAKGGRLRPEQAAFRDLCEAAGLPHLVGGLDEVLAYLQAHGYLCEVAHYRRGA